MTEVDQLSINGREYFFKETVVNPCFCGAVEVDNAIRSIKAIQRFMANVFVNDYYTRPGKHRAYYILSATILYSMGA